MTVAQLERSSGARGLDERIFDAWMTLGPKERVAFIQRLRSATPPETELADEFERHHRSLLARARKTRAAA